MVRIVQQRRSAHIIRKASSNDISLQKAEPIKSVEIQEVNGAFYLLYFDGLGTCVADTWHLTLVDAQEQSRFEFEIREGDWAHF